MLRLKSLLFLLLSFVLAPAAFAQNYPTRPIHLIVGFGAGSSSDVTGRLIAQKLGELLGQSVVVENRPGASSMIAAEVVARSKKDGYTLLLATIANTINTTLIPDKGLNFEKDLAPVGLVAAIPEILVVNPQLEVNSLKDLIALAKEKPDTLFYGASGLGSGPHMASELFKKEAGIKMTGVLYPGSAQTVTDLIAGRIQVMFAPVMTVVDDQGRTLSATGASGTGVLAAILFDAVAPGNTPLSLSGAATGPGGTAMGLQFRPAVITVQP